jgi:hypothetical protein
VSDVVETPPPAFSPIVVQAEAAQLTIVDTDANTNDTIVRDAQNLETGANFPAGGGLRPDFTGSGYLDFGDTPGDRATFSVTVAQAGTYHLHIRYASEQDRSLTLSVNGAPPALTNFTDTSTAALPDGFDNWGFKTVPVVLAAGSNTIALAIPQGRTNGPNIDRLEITQVGQLPDTTADEGADLALAGPATAVAGSTAAFTVAGRDADIVRMEISFDGGRVTRTPVVPTRLGAFTVDLTGRPAGPATRP